MSIRDIRNSSDKNTWFFCYNDKTSTWICTGVIVGIVKCVSETGLAWFKKIAACGGHARRLRRARRLPRRAPSPISPSPSTGSPKTLQALPPVLFTNSTIFYTPVSHASLYSTSPTPLYQPHSRFPTPPTPQTTPHLSHH